MSPESIEYIRQVLISSTNGLIAHHEHLQHQYSLPSNHRITELNDSEIEAAVIPIRSQLTVAEKAIEDFTNWVDKPGRPNHN